MTGRGGARRRDELLLLDLMDFRRHVALTRELRLDATVLSGRNGRVRRLEVGQREHTAAGRAEDEAKADQDQAVEAGVLDQDKRFR